MDMETAKNQMSGRGGKISWRLLALGLILLGVGVAVPSFLTVRTFGIYESLNEAIYGDEKIYVLIAALKLVALNTVRAVPHYLGAFFLAEAINDWRVKGCSALSILVICVTIPSVYFIVENVYHIHYDFGVPALSMLVMMLIFSKIRFDFVNIEKKVLMMVGLIVSIQFLDVMPLMRGLPLGRGESSMDIKQAAGFLGAESFLQGMAGTCSIMFLFAAILMLMLIKDENNIKRMSEQQQQNERILAQTRMRVLENRTYMELNHLVHDLKSPLTSMQALVGVVKLSCESQGDSQDAEYLEKIEGNIERMSSMISEILYEDRLTVVSVQTILTGLLAQTSTAEYAEMLQVDDQVPQADVEVNIIRFFRALANLIENSFYAVKRDSGKIWLKVTKEQMDGHPAVCFEVGDNGEGIESEHLSRIWTKGFSTRSSHGLGLSFVQNTVQQSGGSVAIHSVRGKGTQVRILLPDASEEPKILTEEQKEESADGTDGK